ncbi:uncharacterized protein LOC131672384 isoform X2 [Phymastichus coffea]|uniref:uncharacterized protein LOC131672384 isoform X2 n=1 Tax=Phymastichus coffea TaxID=108790 RepID=UPI00273C3DE9|nr:uncharacterized protein LOC131672384 isoform X2 [Phymastichus coffea]
MEWSNNVNPIKNKFAYYDVAIIKLPGTNVMTGGWGKMENGQVPINMRIGTLVVIPQEQCSVPVKKVYFCTSASIVCLTNGDSGSPLVMSDGKTIIGINKASCTPEQGASSSSSSSSSSNLINVHTSLKFAGKFIHEVNQME